MKKIKEDLTWYNSHSQLLDNDYNDINKFKYFHEFDTFCKNNKEKYFTQKEIKSQADIVFNNSKWEIVIPKTWAASKLYGSNTRWCTASNQDDHHFQNYTERGPLYINIDKRNNTKYQFHPATDTYCDEEDDEFFQDESPLRNESIVDYTNMPIEVVDWYEENVYEIYEKITEEYDGSWEKYMLHNVTNGYVYIIGYFKEGRLYDYEKTLKGEYSDIKRIGKKKNYNEKL